jgi:hypothetical protein
MAKVYFRGSRLQAKQLANRVALALVGRAPDDFRIARGVFLSIGFAALSTIKQDFIVKSRGGTGEDGVKWPPLSKEYLAYGRGPGEKRGSGRRFGKGEKAALKKAAGIGGAAYRHGIGGNRGLLTAEQKKQWQQIFYHRLQRYLLSEPADSAKGHAAAVAWIAMKERGAKTMLEVFGNRKVDILRDTGVLFNSLSPGVLSSPGPNATYAPVANQVFDIQSNGVIVGTSVPYAIFHQEGKNKPRPFLPKDKVPEKWEERWLDAGLEALTVGVRQLFGA